MVLFLSGQEWNDPFVSFSDTGSEYSEPLVLPATNNDDVV